MEIKKIIQVKNVEEKGKDTQAGKKRGSRGKECEKGDENIKKRRRRKDCGEEVKEKQREWK